MIITLGVQMTNTLAEEQENADKRMTFPRQFDIRNT